MEKQKWEDEQELVDPEDSVFRLSASSVKSHKRCPYAFYLSKVQRLPGAKTSAGHLELGSAVHESIEEVFGQDRWREAPRPQNQLRQELISEYRQWNPDVDDEMWEKGLDCLETCAKYMNAYQDDAVVKDIEPEFNFTLGRADISAKFKGFIDLITEDGQIIDWKTGSVREEGEVIQGAVYMRGYQELYGEAPEEIKFVYLDEGKERKLSPSDENWDEMIKHAKRCVQDIRREQFDPEPDETKCYWCDYEGFCDASAVGFGGMNYDRAKQRRAKF